MQQTSGERWFQGWRLCLIWTLFGLCLLGASGFPRVLLGADTPSKKTPLFETDIIPILRSYCWSCHGDGGRRAGLDMRNYPLLLDGSQNGPVIVPGSAEESPLFQRIVKGEMPPEKTPEPNVVYSPIKPTPAQVETLRAWIDAGAPARYTRRKFNRREDPKLTDEDRGWWAFQKSVRHPAPQVNGVDRVRTPIDAFVLSRLEEKGLTFAPDADRATMIRRLSLDLLGLPPSPEEVDAFVADPSPTAYEGLLDRLLASPRYGERWGRHWLDAAGYVDTVGVDNDANMIPRHDIYRYRDYVIRAFNADKPFDRFLHEQLAGDEMVEWRFVERFTPEIKEHLIATGFLRQAADSTGAQELNTPDIRNQVLMDTVQTVSTNLLGLTVHCAQCHTHKFDPISHVDYYRVAGLFLSAYDPQNWRNANVRNVHTVSAVQRKIVDEHNAKVDADVFKVSEEIAALEKPFEEKLFEKKLESVPEEIRDDVRTAIQAAADKRTPVQKFLVTKFEAALKVPLEERNKAIDQPVAKKIGELAGRIPKLQATKTQYGAIQALWDISGSTAYLYRRGDYQRPGPRVEPGVPAVLDDPENPFVIERQGRNGGRRLAFARWLTRDDHPLTARVFVNRVWQQYFGRGIVPTPDNFGASGLPPSHPKLLDWLATEFVHGGWSIKDLHKLICSSAVYRQASRASESMEIRGAELDVDNVFLWRMPLRRLESEAIRDTVLALSGKLNTKQFGPPIPLDPRPDGRVAIATAQLSSPGDAFRRSLYIFARRNYHLTELNVFDQPVVRHNCTRRNRSAVVLQSLAMLNGETILEQSGYFAARVSAIAGDDCKRAVELAFRLALVRQPTGEEIALGEKLLAEQTANHQTEGKLSPKDASQRALANLCQMLLNTNEFLYVQ